MVRFAANLNFLFTETAFLNRFALAKQHGFKAVEYPFPYEHSEKDLASHLQDNGLQQALINLPAGDWKGGERGIACNPARTEEFREGVLLAIRYAQALDCPRANCLAGIQPTGVSSQEANATLVANLRFAGRAFLDSGLQLLIEPINTKDIPGFFLNTSSQGLRVISEVGDGLVGLQYDAYHMQIMEGNLAQTVEQNLEAIGHIQIADNPGRHEPGTGEINYNFFLDHLDKIGYEGWVGCEYTPATTTESGLEWLAAHTSSKI
ncbi:MAG: hydroxypyruvate isomerase [Dehalococcoidia bacterium]|nr:hydroxypyruvate isomerase [Dehalococcoidia bacterium]|tara:strand:- start:1532 stop:2320 length:789 start_codon:yes stop_codon:yes gene_type:complete